MNRTRILLADDHTLILDGLQKLLEPDFELVGTAADGYALLTEAQRLRPDIILLDITMPFLNGIEAARRLKKLVPGAKLIFLTMHTDPAYISETFQLGASGYVLKQSAASELVTAIQEVTKGRNYITPLVTRQTLHFLLEAASGDATKIFSSNLSSRQREVLQLIAEGRSMKDIAKILNISIKTVEFHKSRIIGALGLHTTAELTKYAIAHGITQLYLGYLVITRGLSDFWDLIAYLPNFWQN
jgi:DNA-binding NarL/FixJ family response regulator